MNEFIKDKQGKRLAWKKDICLFENKNIYRSMMHSRCFRSVSILDIHNNLISEAGTDTQIAGLKNIEGQWVH